MNARLTLMEAVARKLFVTAQYNGIVIKLAPHQIFERHGNLFIGAVNLSKNRRVGDEQQLGYFMLEGLSSVTLLDEAFETLSGYQATTPRSDDTLILTV